MAPRYPTVIVFGAEPAEDTSGDFRQVPASDRGNASYSDRGQLGSFAPSNEPYMPPDNVRFTTGFGATMEDLRRGYVEPTIRESPPYDFDNYRDRGRLPKEPDLDDGSAGTADIQDDRFRMKGRRSSGFLPRGPDVKKEY